MKIVFTITAECNDPEDLYSSAIRDCLVCVQECARATILREIPLLEVKKIEGTAAVVVEE